ncbi:related to alpha-L-arabinofuranosidase I precursor [Melanopsichium pennsylvanicum]|uniref:non-reducing end alpha-L-arabinofuranosidase n=2 Tax=Melanopsichium pennsylvanicum TaxID=63383 RepID=A0AAJ4XJP0_9BASI|nr:related to alpha-L-arabinofuranosidase I precursor [Melanopsichium pennsylvanicum 4]SNX83036.1 related to alpha-L-arabinofuranosidase I precursor [Melanopsichium pennsylvanicum]
MKLFFAALAAVMAVSAHGASVPVDLAGSGTPHITEGPGVSDNPGAARSALRDPLFYGVIGGPTGGSHFGIKAKVFGPRDGVDFKVRRGPQTSDGTGAPLRSTQDVKLSTKPKKAKCIYDMNTFVESNLNYGTDGGLYAEMIRNRAFQSPSDGVFGVGKSDAIGSGSLTGWQPVGDSKLELTNENPISPVLINSAKITCAKKESERCGIKNLGFFGLPIEASEVYNASFYIRSDTPAKIDVQFGLYSVDMTTSYAFFTETISVGKSWTPVNGVLKTSKSSPDVNNVFSIATSSNIESFQIQFASLFPRTWQGTVVRKDVAEKMLQFKPKAIRYPGGSDLVGHTIASRFQWNNTIGPLLERPGRLGNWAGWNTEGLGVVEMYNFIQHLGARLIVGLWAGVDANGNSVNLDQLEPYVQQQVDFVHFLLDTTGHFAELRVKSGGPKAPYDVQAFLIGNEGGLTPAVDYQTRFNLITNRLKKEFANHKGFDEIDLIASAPVTVPTGYKYRVDLLNQAIYGTPQDFVDKYHIYDDASRTNNTVFYNMEFATINSGLEPSDNIWFGPGRLHHSILKGSLAESIFILGMENNCDIVRGAAYAPELSNDSDDRASQSTPGLLEFDTTKVVGSTSWLVQSLISANRISQSLAILNSKELEEAKIYASAGLDEDGDIVIKLVNYSENPKSLVIDVGRQLSTAPVICNQVAGNGPLDSNTLQQQLVETASCKPTHLNTGIGADLKKWSFTVFKAKPSDGSPTGQERAGYSP